MDLYKRIITQDRTRRHVFALLSDLHLDASDHDRQLLQHDLKAARELNARISINGDIFDAIVPSDHKRYHPSVSSAAPDRDDIFNQMINYAVEILRPYADLIDVISPGNHERAVLKHHHIDLISMLIYALNRELPDGAQRIHQGAYRGFQQYIFRNENNSKHTVQFVLFRHHGRGGSAPVTGGALDLDRIRKDFDADLYWIGHKHQSIGRRFTRVSVGPFGSLKVKEQRAVMSGGYKAGISTEDPGEHGDKADFGEEFYNTSQQGAQWLVIDVDASATLYNRGIRWSVSDVPYHIAG
jgi:hypothetical protein